MSSHMGASPPASPPASRRRQRNAPQRRKPGGRLARLASNLVFPLLALAALGLLAGVVSCASGVSPAPTPGSGTSAGTASDTSASSADAWIPLRSQEPADVLAAARSGALYREAQTGGDSSPGGLSRLGAPVYVRALRPAGASANTADQLPDFYVVPILDETGAATDAIELALNPTRAAVREIAIITYSAPRPNGSIAQLSPDQALRLVTSQRHVAQQSGAQPYLIYFALAAQDPASQNDQSAWNGGGALPADPIWLVPAADGRSYLAGDDGVAYSPDQLPLSAP